MKEIMLPPFYEIFDFYKPKTIGEIGTWNAKTAVQFIKYVSKYNNITYSGYDIFDAVEGNNSFHEKEINGKGAGSFQKATKNLNKLKETLNFEYSLHQGYTCDTLFDQKFDFVYIDGGHSYDTVKHDYNNVKHSKVIVFDDYQEEPVKEFVDEVIEKENIKIVPWKEAFTTSGRRCAFMPHQETHITEKHGKVVSHIQPVIFN